MEILGKLGIDLTLLVAQIVNFLLLLWILTVFFYKPILKRIDEDEAEIARVDKEKHELTEEQERVKKESTALLKDARARSRKIVKLAEEMAEEVKTGHPVQE